MSRGQLDAVVHHLRGLAVAEAARGRTDAQLLQQFVTCGDEAAFTTLVRRHGRLVRAVCRHVLRCEQDVEDACQATLLVLARKAASIRKGNSVASWLYGVAYRTAMNAKKIATRRRYYEKQSASRPPEQPVSEAALRELQAFLDAEVQRLPEKYRAPFVLCCLEGKSKAEAAKELNWKEGTVSGRLALARKQLQKRLARRGVTLSAALCATALFQDAASATVPGTTVRGVLLCAAGKTGAISGPAAVLAERVIKAMVATKLRLVSALVLTLGILTAGAGVLARQTQLASPAEAKPGESKEPAAVGHPPRLESEPRAGQDRFGDPLPPAAIARMGTVRFRHGNGVLCTAFSPDGRTLASAGDEICFWDVSTGKQIRQLPGHQDRIFSVAFSPDGKTLASGSYEGMVCLWEVASGKRVRLLKPAGQFLRVAFSPDGKTLAASTWTSTIHLWEVATGKEVRQFHGHKGRIFGIAFSPNGQRLASAGWEDGTVRLWEVATGREVRQFGEQQGAMSAVAFSPDGRTLAAGGQQGPIHLWEVATGKELRRLAGHDGYVESLVFTADGRRLASGSYDRTVRLWDVTTGKELRPPGKHLDLVYGISLSPDGKLLASAGYDGLVRLWDVATGKERRPLGGHEHAVCALAISLDGKTLASGSRDGTIRVWEAATGKEVQCLQSSPGSVSVVALSPDGKTLASAGGDGKIRLWDFATGRELRRFPGGGEWDRCLAFSPDGKVLVCQGPDKTKVYVREVSTGKELRRFGSFPNGLAMAALSPDGKILASIDSQGNVIVLGKDFPIRLWDTTTGKELEQVKGQLVGASALAFSPDGKTLASPCWDKSIRLWEVATGKERCRLTGHKGWVYCLAFSPDGRTLASGCYGGGGSPDCNSFDQTIRLWEVATGQERTRLSGHRGTVWSLCFSADGKSLASGSNDTTILVWNMTRPLADGRPQRDNLSAEELQRLWTDLAGEDVPKAYRSVCRLAAAPRQAVPFLQRHLQPVASADPQQLARLIADLDDDRFAVRQKATRELEKLGDKATGALRQVLAGKPSLEVRRRVEQLLQKQSTTVLSPEHLRVLRALEALEQMATPEARQVLDSLATGAPGAWLTQEAKAAQERLTKRSGRPGPPRSAAAASLVPCKTCCTRSPSAT